MGNAVAPQAVFDELWDAFDARYALFELRGLFETSRPMPTASAEGPVPVRR